MPDYICKAKLAPESTSVLLHLCDPTTGATLTTFGNVEMNLTDLTGENKEAKFREIVYQNAACEWKKRWFLCTEEEDAEEPEE
jgi:hypothetical protein